MAALVKPGERFGRYRIVARIGAGGMGEVYRAHDEQLDRDVAIKVLPAATFENPTARARLVREARTASKLNHPNICTIYDVGEADGQAFIAMELVEGMPLGLRLAAGPLDLDTFCRYALQLVEALMHAHAHDIVHRDLKASNIFITTDDRVKVLDFGLAKEVQHDLSHVSTDVRDTLTRPGSIVGTPAYISPQQLRGLPADARSDIWSLGIVLYEMAVCRLPFTGTTAVELMAAILNLAPPPLSNRVPPAIRVMVTTCLEKDPARRYQNASEMRSALQTAAAGSAPRSWPAASRRVVELAMAAIFLAVLALGWFESGRIRQSIGRPFSQSVSAFAERDWLLLADFENRTGDATFDKALDTALAVGLSQSSYVNIVPPSQIEGALRRMRLPAATPVGAATARAIAQRETIKLVLVPSIAEVGGVYQLTGQLQDPATGATKTSSAVRARRKQDVLGALDELVRDVRNQLGEARRSVSQQSKPLQRVTTSSLEALRIFSLGRDARRVGAKFDEVRALYEQALQLDPSFTSARASLGMLEFDAGDPAKGRQLLEDAIKQLDGLTDRERYNVLAFHATVVENNPQQAIDYYRALLAIYPDTGAAYNNIGRAYMQMRRYGEAVAALRQAQQLEPNLMLIYINLNEIFLRRRPDIDAAIATCREQLTYDERSEWAYTTLGWAFVGKGDLAQARDDFQKAIGINPSLTEARYRLAITYRLERHYQQARDTVLAIPNIDPNDRAAYYDAAVLSHLMGDERAARRSFSRYRQMVEQQLKRDPKAAAVHLELAEVLSHLGDHAHATTAAERAMALDPTQHFEYANFLALEGRSMEALDQLQLAVDRGYGDFIWMRADADLESLKGDPRFEALIANGLK